MMDVDAILREPTPPAETLADLERRFPADEMDDDVDAVSFADDPVAIRVRRMVEGY